MSKRFLKAQIIDKGQVTTQGFLRVPATLTRTGVFIYRRDGKIIRELRHPDDVFHPDSLESLKMAPLTDDHPNEFVTPDNVKNLAVGWIAENLDIENGSHIATEAIVADAKTINKVDAGKVELSCGYTADMVEESGVFNGEPYDLRQTNIRYNHVAIVDRGRAGPSVRMKFDKDDAFEENDQNINGGKDTMKKITIDGVEYEVTQAVFDSITSERAKAEKAKTDAEEKHKADMCEKEQEIEDAKKKLEDEKAEKEKMAAKADGLEEKIKKLDAESADEKIEKAVQARIKIIDSARKILGDEAKLDGKSNLEIMKDVIAKESKVDLADKSEVYVHARFDSIVEDLEVRGERKFQLSKGKEDKRADADFDSKAAREKARQDTLKEYEAPLAVSKK